MADWRARSSRRTSRSGSVLTRRGYPRLVNAALAGASPTLADGWSLVPVTRSGTLSSTCATSCASHTASSSSSAGLCELRDARPRCAVDHGAAGTLRLPVVRAGLLDGARDRLLFVLHQALEDAALTPVGLKIARGARPRPSRTPRPRVAGSGLDAPSQEFAGSRVRRATLGTDCCLSVPGPGRHALGPAVVVERQQLSARRGHGRCHVAR
jgi:hypothetical protein